MRELNDYTKRKEQEYMQQMGGMGQGQMGGSGYGGQMGGGDNSMLLGMLNMSKQSPALLELLLPLIVQNMQDSMQPQDNWERDFTEKEADLKQASEFMEWGMVNEANQLYKKHGFSAPQTDPYHSAIQGAQYDPMTHTLPEWEELEYRKGLAPEEIRAYDTPLSYDDKAQYGLNELGQGVHPFITSPLGNAISSLFGPIGGIVQAGTRLAPYFTDDKETRKARGYGGIID